MTALDPQLAKVIQDQQRLNRIVQGLTTAVSSSTSVSESTTIPANISAAISALALQIAALKTSLTTIDTSGNALTLSGHPASFFALAGAIPIVSGYLRQYVPMAAGVTLATFNAQSPIYTLGQSMSADGEIFESDALDTAHTLLYSMVVTSTVARSVPVTVILGAPLLAGTDHLSLFCNGALVTSSSAGTTLNTWNLPMVPGNNTIQWLLSSSGTTTIQMAISSWLSSNVTWLRAAVS